MFYTYLWLREDGTPYYAGKGAGDRAFTSSDHRFHCPPMNSIIVQDFDSEEEAFLAERFLILYYGRIDTKTGCLRNLTDGGEGPSGYIPSKEHRRKIGLSRKREFCPRGHARIPENLSANGTCKTCMRERKRPKKFPIIKLFCIRGHARTPDSVYDNGGCKVCTRNKYKARKISGGI